jgi:hypothetical protein
MRLRQKIQTLPRQINRTGLSDADLAHSFLELRHTGKPVCRWAAHSVMRYFERRVVQLSAQFSRAVLGSPGCIGLYLQWSSPAEASAHAGIDRLQQRRITRSTGRLLWLSRCSPGDCPH